MQGLVHCPKKFLLPRHLRLPAHVHPAVGNLPDFALDSHAGNTEMMPIGYFQYFTHNSAAAINWLAARTFSVRVCLDRENNLYLTLYSFIFMLLVLSFLMLLMRYPLRPGSQPPRAHIISAVVIFAVHYDLSAPIFTGAVSPPTSFTRHLITSLYSFIFILLVLLSTGFHQVHYRGNAPSLCLFFQFSKYSLIAASVMLALLSPVFFEYSSRSAQVCGLILVFNCTCGNFFIFYFLLFFVSGCITKRSRG